ncbi:DUF2235 domain-containing protein [bacterium]|nr:DUF2235 domain-containing protein [bacterium]
MERTGEKRQKDRATATDQCPQVARGILPRSRDGIDQIVYYHEGVGTDGGLDKITGGAFGRGMEQNVRALYRFLVFNFEPDDELFFFGFSRGEFTVRTLAGFMNQVGLLEKDDEYYTPEIYGLYESSIQKDSPEWQHAFRNIRDTRPCPAIRYIGVWDTVGALGPPGILGQIHPGKYKYHDIGLNTHIEHAFHALAIDERRKPFLPSMWTKPHNWSGTLEQVWFPGVHSNIGGSYSPDGLANEALHWMVEKAENLDLEFAVTHLGHYRPCFNSNLNDSVTTFYKLMGPVQRKLGEHAGHGEAIHQSALDRRNLPECAYDPDNLKRYLASGSAPVVNTHRIARGTPCT